MTENANLLQIVHSKQARHESFQYYSLTVILGFQVLLKSDKAPQIQHMLWTKIQKYNKKDKTKNKVG